MRVLLLTPPMTQLNTPYPATAFLTGFLRSRGIDARQGDPSIELVHRLFSRGGLDRVHGVITRRRRGRGTASVEFFLANFERYRATVDAAMAFLAMKDPSLAARIAGRGFLPEGPRMAETGEENLSWAFGSAGAQDRARCLASLYLDDLADVVREAVDERFGFSRYGERLAASQPTFEPLARALEKGRRTLVEEILDEITVELIESHKPQVLALTVPFPGNAYGALRIAKKAREAKPDVKVALGGGYVNTELRELSDPRVFDYVDFITLDDGERPLECLIEHVGGWRPESGLLRTFVRRAGQVRLVTSAAEHDIPARETGIPTYDGLPMSKYLSLLELPNPMHRLWSDARWNKISVAHGCYWKKCSFCDVSLDYIGRYEPAGAEITVRRIEALARETGQTGFHLVDEAAPPAALRAMADRLIERGMAISWWGNIRFDAAFTPELARRLARSGCIAVSGGLEVASDRLLKLMSKGTSVEQVARVARAFREAGVLVHAYLMFGFPTQTEQETIDSLERVRQLFLHDCIQSAYWHRFSATAHSPIGLAPEKFGIRVLENRVAAGRRFARNDLAFEDPTSCDHDRLAFGLRKAVYNFMHGIGLEDDVRGWFDHPAPATTVAPDLIEKATTPGREFRLPRARRAGAARSAGSRTPPPGPSRRRASAGAPTALP